MSQDRVAIYIYDHEGENLNRMVFVERSKIREFERHIDSFFAPTISRVNDTIDYVEYLVDREDDEQRG